MQLDTITKRRTTNVDSKKKGTINNYKISFIYFVIINLNINQSLWIGQTHLSLM